MSFGGFERGRAHDTPMGEINVTPLVDVMLVLLVIFIITAPLLARALKLDLPQAEAPPAAAQAQTIQLTLDAAGSLRWNAQPIGAVELSARLAAAAREVPQPELHLGADRAVRYEHVAAVLAAAQKAGLERIGFVTEPPAAAAGSGATR
jgi:biopolymer transport protein ExbD